MNEDFNFGLNENNQQDNMQNNADVNVINENNINSNSIHNNINMNDIRQNEQQNNINMDDVQDTVFIGSIQDELKNQISEMEQNKEISDFLNQDNNFNNNAGSIFAQNSENQFMNFDNNEGFNSFQSVDIDEDEKITFSMWIKAHKALSTALAIALIVSIVVITYVAINLSKGGNDKNVADSGKEQNIDDEDVPFEDKDLNEEVDELYAELNEGSEEKEVVMTSVTDMSKVKAAPVDDTSDPQPKQHVDKESKSAGAVVDIDKVASSSEKVSGTNSIGIDVSKWQGKIDWNKVASSGIDFAFIRIGYRTTKTGEVFEDPYAIYNMQQAQKAGIKLGIYFYSTAISTEEGKAEAQWVCDRIAKYKITYPVVFDYEGYDISGNRNYKIDSLKKTEIAKAFLDVVKAAGYTPMLYASKSALESEYNTAVINGKYKIWVSQYPATPYPETAKSAYKGKHDIWQYTSKGKVDGVNGFVDVNVSYLECNTIAEAKDSEAPETVTIDPEIGINFTSVNEKVTPKIYVNIRSVPNSLDDSTVVGTVKNGDVLVRTGIGDNGWSRLEYNGKKVYAVTSYLTTNLEDKSQVTEATKKPDNSTSQSNNSSSGSGNSLPSGYKAVNVKVTPKDKVNLRSKASSSSNDTIVASVSNGEVLNKVGEGSNGWSIIDYNGQYVYAITSYLTTDLSQKVATESQSGSDTPSAGGDSSTAGSSNNSGSGIYTTVNEQVTAKSSTNLRSEASSVSADTIVYKLTAGEYVKRTGIGSNGWSRLEYNGQTVYAITSYLTTDKVTSTPASQEPSSENTDKPSNDADSNSSEE